MFSPKCSDAWLDELMGVGSMVTEAGCIHFQSWVLYNFTSFSWTSMLFEKVESLPSFPDTSYIHCSLPRIDVIKMSKENWVLNLLFLSRLPWIWIVNGDFFFNIHTFYEYICGLPLFCLFLLLTVMYKEWNITLNLWVPLNHDELVPLWLGNLVRVWPTIYPPDRSDHLLIWVLCLVPHIPSQTTWMSFFLASRRFLMALKKVFVLFLQ